MNRAALAQLGKSLAESANEAGALAWPDAFACALEIETECRFDGTSPHDEIMGAALEGLPRALVPAHIRRALQRAALLAVHRAFVAHARQLRR